MPSDLKECRQRALRCTELAEKTTDPELKALLKSLVVLAAGNRYRFAFYRWGVSGCGFPF